MTHTPNEPPRLLLRPEKERVLALRESLLNICQNDQYAALLLNAMERMTIHVCRNTQLTTAPFIETSADRWTTELLHVCSERTVRTKLDLLARLGFVVLRTDPGRAPLWQLQVRAVNDALSRVSVRHAPGHADAAPAVDLNGRPLRRPASLPGTPTPGATPEDLPLSPPPTTEHLPAPSGTLAGEGQNFFRASSEEQRISQTEQKLNSTLTETRAHDDAPLSSFAEQRHNPTPHQQQDAPSPLTGPAVTATPDTQPGVLTGEGGRGTFSGVHAPDPGPSSGVAAVLPQPLAWPDMLEAPDPETNRQLLIKALGGPKRCAEFMDEPVRHSDGRAQRKMWLTHIPTERLQTIITQGRQNTSENPWTYITRHLDLELTGPVRPIPTNVINPGSYELKPSVVNTPPREPNDVLDRFAPGTTHEEIASGRTVQIKAHLTTPGFRYVLTDGHEEWSVNALQMHRNYRQRVAAQTL